MKVLTAHEYEKILQFILRIQEEKNDFRQGTLNLLSEIFGYSHMSFFLTDETGHWSNPIVFNISNESTFNYANYYYKLDMFHTTNIPRHLLDQRVVAVTDFMPYEQFVHTEFYNDFLSKYNLHYEIILPLNTGNSLLGVIGVFRPREAGNFSDQDMMVLSSLNKHISNNLKNQLDITQIKREQYIFKNCTFQSPVGLLILNHRLRPIHYNELAKNYCLEITGTESVSRAMDSLVNTLMSRILSNSFNSDIKLGSYNTRIVPLIIPSVAGGVESVYAVYINKPAQQERHSLENAARYFDLTERETEIIELIIKGFNNSEIAQQLYISIHTVKSHVENIFKKTQVSRRTALQNRINEFNAKNSSQG